MNKLLIIPVFLTGCALFWTTKTFENNRDEQWVCEDTRSGARVKAFYYTEMNPSDVSLVIRTAEDRWEVPLQWEDGIINAGDVWGVDTYVEDLRCNAKELRGSIHYSR
jgi:hypothetical protein